jgi:hypothetical protein
MTLSNYPSGHPTGAVATARSPRNGSVRIGLKPSTRICRHVYVVLVGASDRGCSRGAER